MAIYYSSAVGLLGYSLLMQLVFLYAAINWHDRTHRYYLVVSLIPVIRILSFSLPLAGLKTIYWYPIMAVPLFLTCLYTLRTLEMTWDDVGVNLRGFPHQLLFGLLGIFLAISLYQVDPPPPAELPTSLVLLGFHMLVWLICVAALEELIFRGIIMQGLGILWGSASINNVYVALLYTLLHINQGSVVFLALIFGFSVLFNVYSNSYPRSIFGTTLAHGLLNIVYFVILPLARQ